MLTLVLTYQLLVASPPSTYSFKVQCPAYGHALLTCSDLMSSPNFKMKRFVRQWINLLIGTAELQTDNRWILRF